jgi:hypothetical protein
VPSEADNLRIYITIAGTRIAAQELRREAEEIIVRGAAFCELDPSQTRFNFHAISMVEPEKSIPLRKQALLTDVPMAALIRDRYEVYLEQLDLDAKKRVLDNESEE